MARQRRVGEFKLIARYFAPLAERFEGARGLLSDNAFLPADARHDLVVKTDTIVAGVDYLPDERPEYIAAKAVRVCLSDLSAGGAVPFVYLVSLSLAKNWKEQWVARFARGLAADQRRYGMTLAGGDTGQADGPTTITVTAIGKVARGRGLGRDTARAGDELWVSGTIGDAALGLLAARGRLESSALERRYRQPQPRTKLGPKLIGIAHATVDVSDGLLADVGHIAKASGLEARLERERIPLSAAARRAIKSDPSLWANVVAGGDDYELVIAAPPNKRAALLAAGRAAGTRLTQIGHLARGKGVHLMVGGREMRTPRKGYVHF
jgi:thiamine-monophosphate kinase